MTGTCFTFCVLCFTALSLLENILQCVTVCVLFVSIIQVSAPTTSSLPHFVTVKIIINLIWWSSPMTSRLTTWLEKGWIINYCNGLGFHHQCWFSSLQNLKYNSKIRFSTILQNSGQFHKVARTIYITNLLIENLTLVFDFWNVFFLTITLVKHGQ